MLIVLAKAVQEQPGLFDRLVPVAGSVSHGRVQPGYMARRKMRLHPEEAPAAPARSEVVTRQAQVRANELHDRMATRGHDSLNDREAIEAFLLNFAPPEAAAKFSHALIGRFGSYPEALGARLDDIAQVRASDGEQVPRDLAVKLKHVHDAAMRFARHEVGKRPVISSWSALLAYVKLALAHEPREQFRVLFLDKKNQLITDEIMNHGTVDHAPVYPREVARRALEVAASSVIIVHNHPSGDPTPSQADVEMTRHIVAACRTLNLVVHDHLVVGRDGVASFKALSLL